MMICSRFALKVEERRESCRKTPIGELLYCFCFFSEHPKIWSDFDATFVLFSRKLYFVYGRTRILGGDLSSCTAVSTVAARWKGGGEGNARKEQAHVPVTYQRGRILDLK